MKLKKVRLVLGLSLLIISFQNCNSPNTMNTQAQSKGDSKSSASTALSSGSAGAGAGNSRSGLSSGSARSITGGSTRSAGGGLSSVSGDLSGVSGGSAGSTSGRSGLGTCLGCGSSMGIGTGDLSFKITSQPVSKTISENSEFFLGISIQGGQAPYTFKWYRDNVELVPKFGNAHYETYSDVLDRIYKEGEYYATVTDGSGAKLTSNRVQVRMISKSCPRGNYFIDLHQRTNTNDAYYYFNDLFYKNNVKYLVSQHNPTITMMRLQTIIGHIGTIGFGYFTLGGDVSNNQNFSIACSTHVPTIHSPECATNSTSKCYYRGDYDNITQTYEGSVNFLCRNGYIQFVSNTCRLVTLPPPDNGGGG